MLGSRGVDNSSPRVSQEARRHSAVPCNRPYDRILKVVHNGSSGLAAGGIRPIEWRSLHTEPRGVSIVNTCRSRKRIYSRDTGSVRNTIGPICSQDFTAWTWKRRSMWPNPLWYQRFSLWWRQLWWQRCNTRKGKAVHAIFNVCVDVFSTSMCQFWVHEWSACVICKDNTSKNPFSRCAICNYYDYSLS